MEARTKSTIFEGSAARVFQFYLQNSDEHTAVVRFLEDHLPAEFKRMAADKNELAVLGVGSGGGEVDVQILSLLQSTFSTLPITADIVEGSVELLANFKALVRKTESLQKIPFTWHVMSSEDYIKQINGLKTYDFIHLIQMIYYVDDLTESIKFYHSILKKNGSLVIIIEKTGRSWDTLWRTSEELEDNETPRYRSSEDVLASLKTLGLKYEEYSIPNTFDITECFDPNSTIGQGLLCYLTSTPDFYKSFTPQIRSDILKLIRSKCSTEKDGKILFDNCLSCVFVHA
ncbi:histamine N-methyltransferase-like isoform X1 [Hippocampus zosterae]|uniref:histamine N-methyltransferase-like isoform X1 n=1 Tax=Hippocampus zosterae TaxID=109293 RepID=UPI00223D59C2|nr:histamine N-methyltransferase-like isoform X1 [Hippocampus zosterae]